MLHFHIISILKLLLHSINLDKRKREDMKILSLDQENKNQEETPEETITLIMEWELFLKARSRTQKPI